MASATSNRSSVKIYTGTPTQRKRGKGPSVTNYYQSDVTTLDDGSIKTETFRVDAQGNNKVLVRTSTAKDGKVTEESLVDSNLTTGEKEQLRDKSSTLSNAISQQVTNANKKVQENLDQAAAGGITEIGKKNVEVAGGGTGNNASNDENDSDTKPALGDSVDSAEGTRNSFPTLKYPLDIDSTKQDVLKIDMLEYVPQTFSDNQFGFERNDVLGERNSIGSVTLPIPSGISDQNKVDWGSQSMSAFDIAKADIAMEGIMNDLGSAVDTAGSYIDRVRSKSGDVKTAVGAALAAAAAGVEGQQLLTRTTGMVMNPNMELLFRGPALRPFQFKFLLSPRSKDEAKLVIRIIRFFKQGMAPIRSQSNLFIKTPHTFRLKYLHKNAEHRGLNTFKECALQSFGVNYTPTGNYATYGDGTMVQYEISMGFNELEPIFNDQYKDDSKEVSIGF